METLIQLTQRELWVAEDMLAASPMVVAVAVDGEGIWPVGHVNAARKLIRAEYERRVDLEQARQDAAAAL